MKVTVLISEQNVEVFNSDKNVIVLGKDYDINASQRAIIEQ